jgi:hypothetical protein
MQELALGANDISIIQVGPSPTVSVISPPCRYEAPCERISVVCMPRPCHEPQCNCVESVLTTVRVLNSASAICPSTANASLIIRLQGGQKFSNVLYVDFYIVNILGH